MEMCIFGTRPKISVIVPICNVERYVGKCLESLKGQTMKDIEVICIEDGSTDASGAIADEYCNRDDDGRGDAFPLFRVIHTHNKGLSAARNLGIQEAVGEWLMFVDGDDRVDRRFCEIPYRAALEADADMVIFGFVSDGEKRKKRLMKADGVIDEQMAHESGKNVVWNKLYRRSLYQGIQFPIGRFYEDLATTYKVVHKAGKIIRISDVLYFNTIRSESITRTPSEAKKRDYFFFSLEKNNALIRYGYSEGKNHDRIIGSAIGYLIYSETEGDELYKKARVIVETTKGIPNCLSLKQKIALVVWRIDTRLFRLMSKAYKLTTL